MGRRSFNKFYAGQVPAGIWLIAALVSLWGILGPNPWLTLSAAVLIPAFFLLVWKEGEPPILLLALGLQWLQVTTKIFNANVLGVPVSRLNQYNGDVDVAIWLSMLSLLALALGMRLARAGGRGINQVAAREQVHLLSVRKLWLLYLASVPVSMLIAKFSWLVPGGTQAGLALAGLKWAIFFVFAYVCLVRKSEIHLLLAAVVIELALGLGGFFSDFKTVFFMTIVAYVAAGRKFTARQAALVSVLVAFLFALSLVWTAVKVDYRNYANEGTGGQVVTRTYGERMGKLYELVSELKSEDYGKAMQSFADRLSYVDFFARVIIMVPSAIPHEEGALWGGAVEHVLLPRLFFPDKPVLDDTKQTEAYTGLRILGGGRDTSVSLGYVAESYIDFGRELMLVFMLMLGFLWGKIYLYLTSRKGIPVVINYGLTVAVFLNALDFGLTAPKLLGGVLTIFLVVLVVQKFVIRSILPFLTTKRRARSRSDVDSLRMEHRLK